MHPGVPHAAAAMGNPSPPQRCSSVEYARYCPSSRVAGRAPRRPRCLAAITRRTTNNYNEVVKSEIASQDRLLNELDAGVDVSQIDERLRLSPTERLERMRAFPVFLVTPVTTKTCEDSATR